MPGTSRWRSRAISASARRPTAQHRRPDWGLAGFNAVGSSLILCAVRDMLRASMRHAGAIRLDHVLGLKRLYLVPQGFTARDGVYVQMPFEALLAVTARKALRTAVRRDRRRPRHRAGRLSRPDADWGIWSYLVMMFERDDAGRSAIDHYRPNALVTFNTHDLSTYAGWRSFGDLKLKRSLGSIPARPTRRAGTRWRCWTRCCAITASTPTISIRCEFSGAHPSRLLAVSLEDLLGVVDQPNIPGTIDEHPNWRQRLPVRSRKCHRRSTSPRSRRQPGSVRAPR